MEASYFRDKHLNQKIDKKFKNKSGGTNGRYRSEYHEKIKLSQNVNKIECRKIYQAMHWKEDTCNNFIQTQLQAENSDRRNNCVDTWQCLHCTYENIDMLAKCEMCGNHNYPTYPSQTQTNKNSNEICLFSLIHRNKQQPTSANLRKKIKFTENVLYHTNTNTNNEENQDNLNYIFMQKAIEDSLITKHHNTINETQNHKNVRTKEKTKFQKKNKLFYFLIFCVCLCMCFFVWFSFFFSLSVLLKKTTATKKLNFNKCN